MNNFEKGVVGVVGLALLGGLKSLFKRGLARGFSSIFRRDSYYSHGNLNDGYWDYILIYGLVFLLIVILIICMIRKIKEYNEENL